MEVLAACPIDHGIEGKRPHVAWRRESGHRDGWQIRKIGIESNLKLSSWSPAAISCHPAAAIVS
ncbi:MAG: hypothetical protein Q8O86_06225 [Dehalococcoidia bacterium]|nr:hypothetical protein [Dehalococcoidia bacterium]